MPSKAENPRAGIIGAALWHAGIVAWLVIAVTVPSALARAQDHAASKVVELFHDTLLCAMKNADTLGFDGRHELLTPVIKTTFDTPFMVRKAVGALYWGRFSEKQREALVRAFTRMTIATYASRFNGYSGQRFETLSEEPSKHDRILVKTKLVRNDHKPVEFDYVLHRRDGAWAILDIYLAGRFSELAVRRSEFSSILRARGYKGLIGIIESKTSKHRRKE